MNDMELSPADHEALAQSLVAEYGATAQNVAARRLVNSIIRKDEKDWRKWLRVRGCILEIGDTARYTRRLSDKLLWSIEQALESDMPQMAALLTVLLEEALSAEEQELKASQAAKTADMRNNSPVKRPPLGGGVDRNTPEYTRRLSDKLLWALGQSLDQGRMALAQSLKPIYEVAAAGEAARAQQYRDDSGG